MQIKVEIREATPLIANRFHEKRTMERIADDMRDMMRTEIEIGPEPHDGIVRRPSRSASGRFPANRARVVITACDRTADGAQITWRIKRYGGGSRLVGCPKYQNRLEAIRS